jgi:signal transduction histidine kinase
MIAALPPNESERLRKLRDYDILDTLPEQEYQDIVQMAALICGTPIALVSLVDTDRQWFKAKVGLDASETSRESAFCAHALLQPDHLFMVEDATRDARFFDNPLVTGGPMINFYAGAPLTTTDGHVLGTLCVVDRKPRRLDASQQDALFALSRQVMTQLDMRIKLVELEHAQTQLREMSAHQERIKEDERKRIAREIHDELGGLMMGIKSYLSFAADSAQRRGEAAEPHLQDANRLADAAIETLRRVITDLRPSVLDELGVWAALEWFAGEFAERTHLSCSIDIDPAIAETSVDAQRSTALFRIVQETLTNVARHAQATCVEMQARRDGGCMLVEVRDDGRGIDQPELLKRDSWGIAGMYERVRYFGGSLAISGRAGEGTTVTVRLPLENLHGR